MPAYVDPKTGERYENVPEDEAAKAQSEYGLIPAAKWEEQKAYEALPLSAKAADTGRAALEGATRPLEWVRDRAVDAGLARELGSPYTPAEQRTDILEASPSSPAAATRAERHPLAAMGGQAALGLPLSLGLGSAAGAMAGRLGAGALASTATAVATEATAGGVLAEIDRAHLANEAVNGWNILTNAVAGALLDGAIRGLPVLAEYGGRAAERAAAAARSVDTSAIPDAAKDLGVDVLLDFAPPGTRQAVGWAKRAWKASAVARGAERGRKAGARAARDLGGEAAERAARETPEEFAEAAAEAATRAGKRVDVDAAMSPAAKADLEGRVPEASEAHLDWRRDAEQALKGAAESEADRDVVKAWAKSTRTAEPADLLVAGQEAYLKLESEAARAVLRDGLTNAALFGDAAAATRQTFAGVDVLRIIDVGDLGAQLRGDTGRAILDALEQVDAGAKGLGVDAKIDLPELEKASSDMVAARLEQFMGRSRARQSQAGSLVLDFKAPAGLEKAHARFEKAVAKYEGKAAKFAQAEKDLAAAEEALSAADPDGLGGPEVVKLERAVEKAEVQRDRVSRDLEEIEGAADEYYQAALEKGDEPAARVREIADDVLARYAEQMPPEYHAGRKQFLGTLPTPRQAPEGAFFLSPSGDFVDVAARKAQAGSVDIGGTLKGVASSPLGMGVAVGGLGAGAIAVQDDVGEALAAMSASLEPMLERASRALVYAPPSKVPQNPISRFSDGFSDPVAAYRARTDILTRLETDPAVLPELLAAELGDIAETHPELFQREAGRLTAALAYLQENWPRPGGQTALRPEGLPPSREQMRKAALLWSGALDATDVLDDLTNGVASPVQLEAMKACNRELYDRLGGTVRDQMTLAPERMGNQRKAYLDILFDTDGAAGASFSWAVSKFRPPPDAVESHAQLGSDTAAQQPSQPRGMASVASGPTNR